MKIHVRPFAAFRELLGSDHLELEVDDDATAESVFRNLFADRTDIDALIRSTMFAVNRDYVDGNHALHDGDELSLLPPVAGGRPA